MWRKKIILICLGTEIEVILYCTHIDTSLNLCAWVTQPLPVHCSLSLESLESKIFDLLFNFDQIWSNFLRKKITSKIYVHPVPQNLYTIGTYYIPKNSFKIKSCAVGIKSGICEYLTSYPVIVKLVIFTNQSFIFSIVPNFFQKKDFLVNFSEIFLL